MQTPWSHCFPVAVACEGGAHWVLCVQSLLLEVRTRIIFTQLSLKVSMKERRCCTVGCRGSVLSSNLNRPLTQLEKVGGFVKWRLLPLSLSDSKLQVAYMPQVKLSKLFSSLMLLMTNTPNCFFLSYFSVPPG